MYGITRKLAKDSLVHYLKLVVDDENEDYGDSDPSNQSSVDTTKPNISKAG